VKLECPAKALLAAAKLCLPAVPGRTSKAVLKCVRIDAAPGRVTVSATDLEIGVKAHVSAAEVAREGSAVVPADKLVGLLAEAGPLAVTIDADDDGATVKAGRARYKLPVYPPDEFPEVPAFDPDRPHLSISGPTLASAIERTTFAAASADAPRFATKSVLFEPRPHTLRLVATDTKRLSLADAPAERREGEPAAKPALVPVGAARLLSKVAAADTGAVLVDLKPNEALFRTASATIHTKLIEGRFPPYADIIPKKTRVKLALPTAELLATVRRAAITTEADSQRVDFSFEAGKLTLSAKGPNVGSSEVEMELPDYLGDDVSISFDPAYLTDMLRAVGDQAAVNLELIDGNKPAVFKAGDDTLFLIMPLVTGVNREDAV